MHHILVVNSSVSGDSSVSRTLVDHAVQRLLEEDPSAAVHRDLSHGPIPHLTPATAAGVRAVANTPEELGARALSDELIEELRAADTIVIGAPMYNFSIPSSLRAWFDHVLRPRVTFGYSEDGPKGMLVGKRAIVIESQGGIYSEGAAKLIDFQEPYLRQLLRFVGITDVLFVHAERIGFGPEARDAAMATARTKIDSIVARLSSPPDETAAEGEPQDFDTLMQANLLRVFGERDPESRIEAIREIYAADALLNEAERSVRGHEAISRAVEDLLSHLPPDFRFAAMRPALGHHGVGRLQWEGGQPGTKPAVTGVDVAHVEGGLIRTLHVFIDQLKS